MKKLLLFPFLIGLVILTTACTSESKPEKGTRQVIYTDQAPSSIGVYSQAIQQGNALYVSGQIGLIPDTRKMAGEDLESQAHQSLKNIQTILNAAGYRLSDVVSAQVFLSDLNDYQAFNAVYQQYFTEDPPARAVVEVSKIPLNAKVEIMVTAIKN